MVEEKIRNFGLLGITAAAFVYRFFLLTMNTYPPGADIGLHESVINSISGGKTSFFYNFYQMGGEVSATNPGYHIFTSFVISMTALPDYLAQALVASFFSALLVLAAFLIVRRVWGEVAGFIVAVLLTFSASDIVILGWAGYPNIVTLTIIPVVFYLFLQPKMSSKSYVAVASILIGSMFLTHVFSALVFVAITGLALIVCAIFSKKTALSLKQALSWLVPIGLGVLLVSPYLVKVVPLYFGSASTITGAVSETSQAVLETSLIPTEIIVLSMIPVVLFFVFSRFRNGRFLTIPAVLFACWTLVPALSTQSYLLGVYLDYQRFLYFLALPAIACVALIIASVPNALSKVSQRLNVWGKLKIKLKPAFHVSRKALTAALLVAIVVCVLFTPLFSLPNVGVGQVDFFQVMNTTEYQAIQWVKSNTPVGSVCVADAEFGWWLSGFAERPTLSAVEPQYLILKSEIAPAEVATNLLAADYIVSNGLIQVEQAGAYANDNTHDISVILNSSYVYPKVFSLNDTQIMVLYTQYGAAQQVSLSDFNQTATQVISNPDNASFVITRENQFLTITEQITIFKGLSYAEISFMLQNNTSSVSCDWLQVPFQSRGFPLQYGDSIAVVDETLHELTQLVFPKGELGNDVVMQQNPASYELIYNLQGNASSRLGFYVGLSQYSPEAYTSQPGFWDNLIENNANTYLDKTSNLPLNCFDYKEALTQWNVSYIIVRDFIQIPRFSDDPMFTLVFKNSQVAIFKVNKS